MSHHSQFLKRGQGVAGASVGALMLLALSAVSVAAQTPTPWPSPTPDVHSNFVVVQEVTYGDGGIILGLLFVSGLLLLDTMTRLAERLTDR